MTATTNPAPGPATYTGAEVAALFRVHPRVVTRWAAEGKFDKDKVFRTLGGHRRYDGPYIRSLTGGAR